MKRLFFLFAAAMIAGSMMAQTAVHNYDVTLKDGETWEVPNDNPYQADEKALGEDYAQQVASSALFRALGGQSFSDRNVREIVQNTKQGLFDYGFAMGWGSLGHKLIQNKLFRDFLMDRCCAILKDMCRLYPASTKQTILNLIDKTIRLTDHMWQHTYKIAKITHTYDDGSTWTEEALQKDSKVYNDNFTDEDLEIVYGLEGFIARRILIDGIRMSEIRAYLQAARKAVEDEDVSKKPEYVACYTINDDLKVVLATDHNFYRFQNGKQVNDVESVTFLKDASGTYYKIVGPFVWMTYEGRWQGVTNSILYDKDGTPLITEILTKQ